MSESAESTWESLAPFEKAQEWMKASPEIAGVVLSLGQLKAEQRWEMQQVTFEHHKEMDRQGQARLDREDTRTFRLQLIGLCGSLLSVLVNAAFSVLLARQGATPQQYAPLAAGTLVAGGSYWGSRLARGLGAGTGLVPEKASGVVSEPKRQSKGAKGKRTIA